MVLADLIASGSVTVSIEWLTANQITSDRRVNTRPVDSAWVARKLKEGFDPNLLGVPMVSRRADGTQVWLDGQNRGSLMQGAGWGAQKIQCRVFTGLTPAQEAELFLGHNDNRQVKVVYKFLARVTSGDEDAAAINAIVQSFGWRINDQAGGKNITAVKSLERIFHGDRNTDDTMAPGRALQRTLRVVTEAWGYKSEAANGDVILGIGSVFNRFGDIVDLAVLIKKLAEFPAGPSGLLGKARGMRQYQGGTVAHCVAETVVTVYNARRRTNVLPDWR